MHLVGFGLFVEDVLGFEKKEVDKQYKELMSKGVTSVLEPSTEPWRQRTCYIADPEGNLLK